MKKRITQMLSLFLFAMFAGSRLSILVGSPTGISPVDYLLLLGGMVLIALNWKSLNILPEN